jgi:hypothetical protein
MKIPIRGFLVISANSPYPEHTNFFIGGVAKSVAHEKAAEEDGIVVELTGSYDKKDLESLVQERIDDYTVYVKVAKTPKDQKTNQELLDYYIKLLKALESNKLSEYTNLAHFSQEELDSFNKK